MKILSSLCAALLLLALVAAGCSDSTGPNTDLTDSTATNTGRLKVGTRYHYNVFLLDANNQPLPGVVNSGVVRVTSNNENYRGKSGAVVFQREKDRSLIYVHTEETGISLFTMRVSSCLQRLLQLLCGCPTLSRVVGVLT